MFTKAIVLSESEFRSLVSDLVEVARGEFGDVDSSKLEEFLAVAFEEVLDAYGVDEVMVNLNGEWHEVTDAESFMSLVGVCYKDLGGMLEDMKGGEEVGGYAKEQ